MFKGLRKKASILSLTSITSPQSNTSTAPSSATNSESNYDKILTQVYDFEVALKAMDYLLDDRTKKGTDLLQNEADKNKDSTQPHAIFPLALGVMEFIEATLGFEPEVMARAHKTLSEAENASLNNSKYNVKYHLATSLIYPPGTEFQVTYAESTLLNALLMLLTENNGMVESAKALFKLRRAYQTLDAVYKRIKDSEPVFNKNLAKLKKEAAAVSMNNGSSKSSSMIYTQNRSFSTVDLPGYNSQSSSSGSLPQDIALMKNLEKIYLMRKARVEGASLGNSVHPESVNLFEDSNSSLTLAKQTNTSNIKGLMDSEEQSYRNSQEEEQEDEDDDDDDFCDASESFEQNDTLSAPPSSAPVADSSAQSVLSSIDTTPSSSRDATDNHLHVSTIDEYIHSGVQLCFGILQVVLSLIPPAIGKVLSIVGFKGDREVGLRLLWRTAITSRNIHGELALLFLLVFYDGPVQFVDNGFHLPGQSLNQNIISLENRATVSDSELDRILDNPPPYTSQLLRRARRMFPHNALWILQEGRMLAAEGDLAKASKTMQDFTDNPATKIQMQQAEALLIFDRSIIYIYQHEYDKAAKDLIYLIEINSWSKAVYLFMASACYLEKYRMIKMGIIDVADKQAELKKYSDLFDKYLDLALSYVPGVGHNAVGKKGGIGGSNKQMPFDKFLLRKSRHIETRKKQYPKLSTADIVGTSLIHELVYFWNGYNRMTQKDLKVALQLLGYSGAPNTEYSANTSDHSYALVEETEDEAMIRYFLQSVTLRQLGDVQKGLSLLDNHVISKYVLSDSLHSFRFNKLTYSPYIYPTALYEKTMFVWLLRTAKGSKVDAHQAVEESRSWLKRAEIVGEGDYELSNRTGMRIKAAGDRLEQLSAIS
ncbi:Mitochondrial outer membrane protein IML2 [Candida maltosa Xu316]|uniref:Mitochondrial outer membrane protein IML2 n=1 Tax=Candida maltosa (strain Xu316) TaxID=1245528 RepID=M3JCS3_CANMX|nr:Mitochondrial outer membrane protein IML2 [Candida maltosa Xu316]